MIKEGLPRRFWHVLSPPMDPCVPIRGRQGDPGEPGNRRQAGGGRQASSAGGVLEEIQAVKHESPSWT